MKQNLLVPALVVVAMATVGTGVASAHGQGGDRSSKPAISQADMEKKIDERLSQLVTDGKITAAQKELLAAKQKEMASQREAKNAALKTELEQWAKDNGIDVKYIMPFGGPHGPGRGMHRPGEMRGNHPMNK